MQAELRPGTRVFYIRCSPVPNFWLPLYYNLGGVTPISRGIGSQQQVPSSAPVQVPPPTNRVADSLERTIEPLHPRLFDVTTALEFRHALASILNEMSKL